MIPIIGARPQGMIEVCRSFAYKLNLKNHGGPDYESVDFFASRKMECAIDEAATVSQTIFEECRAEVRTSVKAFIEEMQRRRAPKKGTAREFDEWKKEQTA